MADVTKDRLDIMHTKFFEVVMNDIFKSRGGEVSADIPASPVSLQEISPTNTAEWAGKANDLRYLENLLGELEKRRALAVMCITPDKIVSMNATRLSIFVMEVGKLIDDIDVKIKKIQRQNKLFSKEIKSNLSGHERDGIDNLIKNA
jgi:hypothetical protein